MFLHLGGDMIVPKKDVIAIIDLKQPYKSKINAEFLRISGDEGVTKYVGDPTKIKSFILTINNVYYSPISSSTLKKRADSVISEEEEEDEEEEEEEEE